MIGSSAAFSDFFGGICQESGLCLPPSKVCACDLNFETRTDRPTQPPLFWPLFCPLIAPLSPCPALFCPYFPWQFRATRWREEGPTLCRVFPTSSSSTHNIQKLPRLRRLASKGGRRTTCTNFPAYKPSHRHSSAKKPSGGCHSRKS